ncbi:MAG: hypothetical protein LUH40_05850, partial [Clostridiales bacterium]|nr:hypothetical protein [Clostridiales bacterium]
MAKTKTVFRKALAVFLCGVMCFANFALGASADYAGWPSGNPNSEYYYLTMYADDSGYGTPQWDQSTGLEYMTWYKSDNPSEYIKIYYPSEIYLDVTETLQSAGYALHMEAVYGIGSNATDYRVVVCSIIWGELSSNYSEVSNDYGSSHAFANMFDNYTAVGTLTEGTKLASTGTSDADHIDDDAYSDERTLLWRNPSTSTQVIDEYIVLQGTPKSTGTGAFTTYGWNTTSGDIFVAFQKYESEWFSYSWKDKATNTDKGTESSLVINGWNDIRMAITIYDKSELNTEIENAENFVDPNADYVDLLVSGDWNAYTAAKAAAETVLTTREVTQEDIESAK